MSDYSDSFEAFWTQYPRKTGKGKAWQAWQKLKPTPALLIRMVEALEWQRDQPQWQKDHGTFIPLPTTWLNQRRWDDEPFENLARPKYFGWDCPHQPPCEQRHWCDLKTAKAAASR